MRIRLAVLALSAALAGAAQAGPSVTFHLMQIEQAIGGVNGDTGAQAVQLRMRFGNQSVLSEARLVAWDAQGLNPVVLIDFATDVPNGAIGARVLVATAGFAAHTSPEAKPDYVMDPIPESYLAAGRLTFENDAGNDIVWSLAWGGAAYTGPHNGSIFNDDNGNYGPAWDGPLPSTGIQALQFQGAASAQSKSNSTDYKLTDGAAVFTNNANESFTVVAPACYPDCDGDEILSIDDFVCFQTFFAFGDPYADCDGDTILSIDDFVCFQTFFAFGCD
jgi:hypothetical protein